MVLVNCGKKNRKNKIKMEVLASVLKAPVYISKVMYKFSEDSSTMNYWESHDTSKILNSAENSTGLGRKDSEWEEKKLLAKSKHHPPNEVTHVRQNGMTKKKDLS
jgi:hypothetical protein